MRIVRSYKTSSVFKYDLTELRLLQLLLLLLNEYVFLDTMAVTSSSYRLYL